ncbi:hypothetical protein REB14_06920 [Chryseobacterium sp. ES2]|uniref:SMI1/KNR4 family protein n=1 Tax=Chryseobacterium metallicongregator TaxID=3073042 RepID=A0ABU1E280_9FLAO|nr:hypothetical protein [Chryseobacterium sp. ES2]MDR4951912.1 hypothetical protein [Chryseobacterium sp. ES2]
MKLINTIEISPLRYAKEEFELPESSDYPDPEEWYTKWEEVASRLNFNFKTIQKGSYLVNIEDIDDDNLEMIVEAKMEDMESDESEEDICIMAFDGGIVLKIEDEILIQPSCCGDISNIEDWRNIFKIPSSEWKSLWIGHPWVFYKWENGKVCFSEYTESNVEDVENIKIVAEVEESELKAELEKVVMQQINLKNRIMSVLKTLNCKYPEKISKQLAGIKE